MELPGSPPDARVPGFSRLVSEESGGPTRGAGGALFTSVRPARPHLSRSVKHPSPMLQKHCAMAAFTGCDQNNPNLIFRKHQQMFKIGVESLGLNISQAGPWSSSRELSPGPALLF